MRYSNLNLIVALSTQGIIAIDGKIPWKKPADMKRFKSTTMNSTLIMGRKTWDSMGRRKLPGREIIVLSRTLQSDVATVSSIEEAIVYPTVISSGQYWVVGGAEIYELALPKVASLDVTVVLDHALDVTLPKILQLNSFLKGFPGFELESMYVNPGDPSLEHRRYLPK